MLKNIEGYAMFKFEVVALVVSEILKNHFVTAGAAAAADIDDSIKRKPIRLKKHTALLQVRFWYRRVVFQ